MEVTLGQRNCNSNIVKDVCIQVWQGADLQYKVKRGSGKKSKCMLDVYWEKAGILRMFKPKIGLAKLVW